MRKFWPLAIALIGGGWAASSMASPAPEAICSSTTTIFCSGFEEGSFSIWNDYDGNPAPWNLIVSDPGPLVRSDNHVTVMTVPAGRGGTDLVKVLPRTVDKAYVRWYQKWEPGFDFSVGMHGGGIHAGDRNLMGTSGNRPTGSDWFSTWIEPYQGRLNMYTYYRGMYMDCSNPVGSCWGDHFPCFVDSGQSYCTKVADRPRIMPPLLVTDRWYCIEFMVDAGTPTTTQSGANGAMDLWIDGTEYGPFNNLWFRTTPDLKINILSPGIFFHADHSTAGVRFDDIVVSTQRIGCEGGKLPNPPTNVTVN